MGVGAAMATTSAVAEACEEGGSTCGDGGDVSNGGDGGRGLLRGGVEGQG